MLDLSQRDAGGEDLGVTCDVGRFYPGGTLGFDAKTHEGGFGLFDETSRLVRIQFLGLGGADAASDEQDQADQGEAKSGNFRQAKHAVTSSGRFLASMRGWARPQDSSFTGFPGRRVRLADRTIARVFGKECVQLKAGMFSGSQSHRGKSQKPRSLDRIGGGNEADEAD